VAVMVSIKNIEGIGSQRPGKLAKLGIKSTDSLLKKGATSKGRKEIEEKTGFDHKLILGWVNRADLFRIKGVAEEYSDLLEEAGVDTVVELAQRNAENLYAKIIEVNNAKKLVRRPPALSMIKSWIEQAKKLDRIVEY
jgi:predicted flap endonuclease-1-like 5' DNA nuclease